MFFSRSHNLAADAWKTIKLNGKAKLYRVHHFLYMAGGKTFSIEVQEDSESSFQAHAENNSDPHDPIKSVNGNTLEESLEKITQEIEVKQSA